MSKVVAENERASPAPGRNVLVAEDSSITQDLLKLVLSQRGHNVEIVGDGEEALEALRRSAYDVALLDFHLPKLDGVQVVAAFLAGNHGGKRPRFVAITADVEGLLSHTEQCESFDKVVPKPVDIRQICAVIDETAALDDPAADAPEEADEEIDDLAPAPRPSRRIAESPIQSLGYKFLTWPDDFDASGQPSRALQARIMEGGLEAVLVKAPATAHDLALLWRAPGLHLLPVLDLSGALGLRADLDCSKLSNDDAHKAADLIEAFLDRRARVHRDVIHAEELWERLLGRIYVSNAPLAPFYDPRSHVLVSYNAVLEGRAVINETRRLVDGGFLTPAFFDRTHECASCGSAHFNIREDCPECRSANLSEEPYIHHFKCAYQGPESDFRQDDDLICPKCRKELLHFGRDYDKPGAMITCGGCGHTTSEPSVGLICVSCGLYCGGDAARTRDVFRFTPTDQATGFVEAGRAFLGFSQQTLRFADLPLDLVVSLNEAARQFNEGGTPFSLLDIAYQNEREIEREHGARQFQQLRSLFLENLRALLAKDAKLVKGQAYDFVLLRNAQPEEVRAHIDGVCAQAVAQLRLDPGVAVTVFGPEDLS